MPKSSHAAKEGIATGKTTNSVGSRGESATARNLSGNHHGDKAKSNRRPKNQRKTES